MIIVVKPGKYGPTEARRGPASVPEDLTPDDLTVSGHRAVGRTEERTSRSANSTATPCTPKTVRYGRTSSGVTTTTRRRGSRSRRCRACSRPWSSTDDDGRGRGAPALPRELGVDPADGGGHPGHTVATGRTSRGKDYRNIDSEDQLLQSPSMTREDLQRPKGKSVGGGHGGQGTLREFGTDPVSERAVVAKDGKFGVYVTTASERVAREGRSPEECSRGGRSSCSRSGATRSPPTVGPRKGRTEEGAKKAARRRRLRRRWLREDRREATGEEVGRRHARLSRSVPSGRWTRSSRQRSGAPRTSRSRELKGAEVDAGGRLAQRLDAVLTRETGGTEIVRRFGNPARHHERAHRRSAEALLAAADRGSTSRSRRPGTRLRPLRRDRSFCVLALAYQGYGRQLDIEHIRTLNNGQPSASGPTW